MVTVHELLHCWKLMNCNFTQLLFHHTATSSYSYSRNLLLHFAVTPFTSTSYYCYSTLLLLHISATPFCWYSFLFILHSIDIPRCCYFYYSTTNPLYCWCVLFLHSSPTFQYSTPICFYSIYISSTYFDIVSRMLQRFLYGIPVSSGLPRSQDYFNYRISIRPHLY